MFLTVFYETFVHNKGHNIIFTTSESMVSILSFCRSLHSTFSPLTKYYHNEGPNYASAAASAAAAKASPTTPPTFIPFDGQSDTDEPSEDSMGFGLARGTTNTYAIDGMDEMSPLEYQAKLQETISARQVRRWKQSISTLQQAGIVCFLYFLSFYFLMVPSNTFVTLFSLSPILCWRGGSIYTKHTPPYFLWYQ